MNTNTKPIRSYNKHKPPMPGTCKACTHFSLGYKMKSNGYCMKHRCSTRSDATCIFYREPLKR